MAEILLLDKNNKQTKNLSNAARRLDLIERSPCSQVFVDQTNTKRKVITAFSDRRYARNSAGIFVNFADEVRGGNQLRVASPSLNFQAVPELGQFHHYDDGFNRIRAIETVSVEIKRGEKWETLPLSMIPGEINSKSGKGENWSGYKFKFVGEGGELTVDLSQDEVGGKGDYSFKAKGSDKSEYRLKIELVPTKGYKKFFVTNLVEHGPLARIEYGAMDANWEYGANDALCFNWRDMLTDESLDIKSSKVSNERVVLYSKGYWLDSGDSFLVDPVIGPTATSSGVGNQNDSAWAVDGNYGNTILAGTYAPLSAIIRAYARFTFTGFTGTVNDADLTFYVAGHLGNFNYDSLLIGDYNDTGQGNPASDAYATAYGYADVQTGFFVNDVTSRATGSTTVDLGTTAEGRIATAAVNGEFTICFNDDNANAGATTGPYIAAHNNSTTGNRPVLTIDYTETGGGGSTINYTRQNTINNRRRKI